MKCIDCKEKDAVNHPIDEKHASKIEKLHEGRCCDCFDAKVLGIPVEEIRSKDRARKLRQQYEEGQDDG